MNLWRRVSEHRLPFVPQMEAMECGAASLCMVMGYHGRRISLAEVRDACGVGRNGVNASAIIQAAAGFGFHADGYSVSIAQVRSMGMPLIVHWGFDHFVVLEGVEKDGFHIVDPAVGRRRVGTAEFSRMFTGVVILLEPSRTSDKNGHLESSAANKKRFLLAHVITRKEWWALATVGGAAVLTYLVGMVFPLAMQLLVDSASRADRQSILMAVCAGLVLGAVATESLGFVRSWVIGNLQVVIDQQLMGVFVAHLMSLPMRFFIQRRPGDLVQRVALNERMRDILVTKTIPAILDCGVMLVGGGLAIWYDPWVGCVVWVGVATRVGVMWATAPMIKEYAARELAAGGREASVATDALMGVETIKAARMEDAMLDRWFESGEDRRSSSIAKQDREARAEAIAGTTRSMLAGGVVLLGGMGVMAGRITPGAFGALVTLQSLVASAAESLFGACQACQSAIAAIDRLADVLDTEPEEDGCLKLGEVTGRIDFEGVTFYYPGSPVPAVSNVSLSIAPGERVGIVGGSGSGKSTLLALLTGIYKPTEGRILLDGIDMRRIQMASARRYMGVVLQDGALFDDTILANVSMGDPAIGVTHVVKALQVACMDDDVSSLPDGYRTTLGKGGERLSGGQRQRIRIARAIVGAPPILLMDEATSALDVSTEEELHRRLANIGCTRVVIAHRPATILDSDRVVVMDQGQITACGTPKDLLCQPGHFRSMVAAWEAVRGGDHAG